MKYVFLLSVAVICFSCSNNSNYATEIAQIDSLLVRIDSIPAAIQPFNADSLSVMAGEISGQLDYIQDNFEGEMRLDIAKVTGECRITRKALKNAAEQISQMGVECARTKKQLMDLKQALQEGATHDAAGNKMDASYVQKALARELEEAGKLIKARNLLEENVPKAKEKYLRHKDKMQFWVDSIPARNPQPAR